LDGAKIFTWPWTDEVTSDANGNFEFEKIKVYDNTVVYARKDGYATSLASFTSKSSGITVSLSPLPDSVSTGGLVNGLAIDLSGPSSLDKMIAGTESRVSALKPGFIRLSGMETTGPSRDAEYEALDRFISYVKKIGAEPILGVSLGKSPEEAGALVRYCNLEKGYHVRYWAIGNEPDLLADKDPSKSDYNVYDYVNDFREFYNAMKQADPSIWVMGPELAWKYEEGTNDWITPFLQYNGDIVNMISIHHYAALNPAQTTLQTLWGDPRKLLAQLRHLQDQISENEDVSIPLAFTGGNIYSAGGAATISNSVTLLSISPALWMGDEMGLFSKEGISTNLFSFTKEKGTAGFMADSGVHPAYEVLKTFNALFKGDVLPTQTQMEGIAAYAIRDPGSKNIVLMIISKKNYYSRLNISFDGKGSDLIVDGGLNRKINYEVPSYSISFLKIRADHSSDQVWLYTQKMAVANIVPEMKSLKE
jgi:hypothetical protein